MVKINNHFAMAIAVVSISGCAGLSNPYVAYTNKPADMTQIQPTSQASFVLRKQREAKNCTDSRATDPKKNKNVLVLLALSGGGSRAAYFSALSMLEMQKTKLEIGGSVSNVLHEVDVISSVSGGSLAGAYYAASHDAGSECAGYFGRQWNVDDDGEIRTLMKNDYRNRWVLNGLWPANIVATTVTDYDRTDVMAQTLADNLFDTRYVGSDLTLGELNGLRPNLILNATTGSSNNGNGIPFGQTFTFTTDDFSRICSSIEDYSVARAVMATATFPGIFNFMTLRDYCGKNGASDTEDERYLHVFDGGNADNLGLTSLKRVIWEALRNQNTDEPKRIHEKIIVILVDAFTRSRGADSKKSDPRDFFDFIVDTNFLDATDSLLEANRTRLIEEFNVKKGESFFSVKECRELSHGSNDVNKDCSERSDSYLTGLNAKISGNITFVHLNFDKVSDVEGCKDNQDEPGCLRQQLNRIPTDFKLKSKVRHGTRLTDAEAIACATPTLFGRVDDKSCTCGAPTKFDQEEEKSCGKLFPKNRNEKLTQDWEAVKNILENTVAKD